MPTDDLDRIFAALEAGPSVTDWISAIATLLTAFIAIGALFYAAGQIKEAKAARLLASDLEVKRAQPYVVLYTEQSAATNLAIDLVIKNFGPTAATDVRVVLDPWPERAGRSDDGARVGIPTFPVLAPGQEWRTSWVWTPDRERSELPARHEGFVTFLGIDDEEFTSPVVLDLGIYTHREWIEVRGIHDAAQALRDIRDNQKKWTEDLHGSLSVVTRDGAAKDERERNRMEEVRARRAARATTPPEQAEESPVIKTE
ncbi:hypothetical protein [Microbacterium sp. NPDC055599]